MSAPRACPECLRRARLLAHLAPYIEKVASGAPGSRSPELLRLSNEDLADAAAPKVARTDPGAGGGGPGAAASRPSWRRRAAGPAAVTIPLYPPACATPPTRRGR